MKILSAILFAVLFTISALAQDSCKTEPLKVKHGIQFQIVDLLRLANYRDYTFSYRYLLNENSGLRFGVNLNYADREDDNISKSNDSFQNSPSDVKIISFKLSAQYLLTLTEYHKFKLIIGGGPFYSRSNSKTNSSTENSYVSKKLEYETKFNSYGLDLLAGVEYWLTENLVFSGESGISSYFSNNESERTQYENYYNEDDADRIIEDSSNRDEFIISNLSVNLGIAVFF